MPSPEQLVALAGVIVAVAQLVAIVVQAVRGGPVALRHADGDTTSPGAVDEPATNV